YSALKSAVADGVIEVLAPIQQRYRDIRSDDAALLQQLRGAADRLTPVANATLHRVQEAVGLRCPLPVRIRTARSGMERARCAVQEGRGRRVRQRRHGGH